MLCSMKQNTAEQGTENIISPQRVIKEDIFMKMIYVQSSKYEYLHKNFEYWKYLIKRRKIA